MVRVPVEETFNKMLNDEAYKRCNADRCQRTQHRMETSAGYYPRNLHTKAGEIKLSVPRVIQ